MRAVLLAAALGTLLATPMGVSATTFTPVTTNQGFVAFDAINSRVDLGSFNLADGAIAIRRFSLPWTSPVG